MFLWTEVELFLQNFQIEKYKHVIEITRGNNYLDKVLKW